MRNGVASVRDVGGLERVNQAVRAFEEDWSFSEPTLRQHWARYGNEGSVSLLAALVKADLRCRYACGQMPTAAEYLEQYPELQADGERVLSLVYEEFCLREERGEHPVVEEFCDRYAHWRDSLVSQLRYHQLLSQVVAAPTVAPQFPKPGDHFEEFRLLSRLGQGGASQVFLARDESLGQREVALKITHNTGCEPSILGQLEHDNIIQAFSVRHDAKTGLRGLCMRYRAGLPLDKIIAKLKLTERRAKARDLWDAIISQSSNEPRHPAHLSGWKTFPSRGTFAEAVAWVVATLARALAYAHSRGVLHRDVKPANVLLTLRDGPQLLDFNLAHNPHAAERAEAALNGGTLPYMAPEQLRAFLDPANWEGVGKSADIYSLGLVLREMLSGQQPELHNPNLPLPRAIRDLLDRRAEVSESALHCLNPSFPHALEAIVARCLAEDPEDRYPDAGALAEDLERFIKHRPLRYAVNKSRREITVNRLRRHVRALTVAAVVMLTLGGIAVQLSARFVPPQDRGAFQQALLDLNDGRYPKAAKAFRSLVEDYPDSAGMHFYLSYALAKMIEPSEADREFIQAMFGSSADRAMTLLRSHPDRVQIAASSSSAFVALAKNDPKLTTRLVEQGDYYLNRPVHEQGHQFARPAYQAALLIEPRQFLANEGLASLDTDLGNYREIRERLSPLIIAFEAQISDRATETRSLLRRRFELATLVKISARALVKWARDEFARNRIEEARVLFGEARRELEGAQPFLNANDLRETYANQSIRALIEVNLSELELKADHVERSTLHYEEAGRIIDLMTSIAYSDVELEKLKVAHVALGRQLKQSKPDGRKTDPSAPPTRTAFQHPTRSP